MFKNSEFGDIHVTSSMTLRFIHGCKKDFAAPSLYAGPYDLYRYLAAAHTVICMTCATALRIRIHINICMKPLEFF
jgi:hypothetical protein